MRDQIRAFVEHRRVQQFVIAVIVLNAVTLGLETSDAVMAHVGSVFHAVDRFTLAVFVVELALRLYAYRWRFFTDGWNLFDFAVVAIALVPATGPFSVLRALRILRALRLVSAVPAMRRVVSGLLSAIPGLASITVLLFLIIYVAAVMATNLFGDHAPEYFDDLGTSLFTLFQTMTGEAWPDVARAVMEDAPIAWIFFVIYIVISTFAVLNLFIAVIVSGMQQGVTDDLVTAEQQHAADQARADQLLLDEIRALRAEVAQLRTHV